MSKARGEYLNVDITDDGTRIITSSAHDIVIKHSEDETSVILTSDYSNTSNLIHKRSVVYTPVQTLIGITELDINGVDYE